MSRFIGTCVFIMALVTAVPGWSQERPSLSVRIEGIENPLLENVRRFLSISALQDDDPGIVDTLRGREASAISEAEIRRRHLAARQQITQALVPYGYYRPEIDASLESTTEGFVATYRIDPGTPATLDEVDIRVTGEGEDFPAIESARADIELETGDVLNHSRYEAAKTRLFDTAYDNGFLEATWRRSQIRVSPDRSNADIVLHLDTGPRFYFGEVTVEQDILDPRFGQRFVEIEPGDPYDVSDLLALQTSLSQTEYFSRIEVETTRDVVEGQQRLDVTVTAEPAKPIEYTMGLGFGTDTGPRATVGAVWRRINRYGHRLEADLVVSSIEQAIGVRYTIPIRDVRVDSLDFSATALSEEIGDVEADRISLRVGQSVGWLGFRRNLYLAAERETFEFEGIEPREVDLVFPGILLVRERFDDPLYPRDGHTLRADLHAGVENLLSEVSFSRFEMIARWIRGLGERSRFIIGGSFGALWTDDFGNLPPSQRFFAGGDRSIRGYAFEEVAPRNALNAVIGGERLLTASIEYERLLFGDYGAALFIDTGDAFNSSPDFKTGAGVGFRWRSPVGIVRLDLAHPFDDPDTSVRIHFTIGTNL